jgi:hypothetical protein
MTVFAGQGKKRYQIGYFLPYRRYVILEAVYDNENPVKTGWFDEIRRVE